MIASFQTMLDCFVVMQFCRQCISNLILLEIIKELSKDAHTRNFTQISFEFYVDNEYKSLRFVEHWMEFITGGSIGDPSQDTYHFKMRYPDEYKANETRVVKFERNHSHF